MVSKNLISVYFAIYFRSKNLTSVFSGSFSESPNIDPTIPSSICIEELYLELDELRDGEGNWLGNLVNYGGQGMGLDTDSDNEVAVCSICYTVLQLVM